MTELEIFQFDSWFDNYVPNYGHKILKYHFNQLSHNNQTIILASISEVLATTATKATEHMHEQKACEE